MPSLVEQFVKGIGGDVLSDVPQSTQPAHGEPINPLSAHGWTEVPPQQDDGSDDTDYKHEDFPGHLISFNFANGAWDHQCYDEQVASGAGTQALQEHLTAFNLDEKQTSSKKIAGQRKAYAAAVSWSQLSASQQNTLMSKVAAWQTPLSTEIVGACKAGTVKVIKKSPPGWEGTVESMKEHPEIDNPWALSWAMYNEGDTSHKAAGNGLVEKFCTTANAHP